jgi:hypothetical protein
LPELVADQAPTAARDDADGTALALVLFLTRLHRAAVIAGLQLLGEAGGRPCGFVGQGSKGAVASRTRKQLSSSWGSHFDPTQFNG